jgi:hypothetical protein
MLKIAQNRRSQLGSCSQLRISISEFTVEGAIDSPCHDDHRALHCCDMHMAARPMQQ